MLNGKIKEDKDFMLMLAYNVCRLKDYQDFVLTECFKHIEDKEIRNKIIGKLPCDVRQIEWLWEALERGGNSIYSDKKSFNKTYEEVKNYLYY